MTAKHIAAIEVGTARTAALLATRSPRMDGSVLIRAFAEEKTAGIRKSEVHSASSVVTTVTGVLDKLSKNGRTDINQIDLVYSGGDLAGMPILGNAQISNPSEVVEEEDLEAAIEAMRAQPLPSGRTTVEEMRINCVLDGIRSVEDPCSLSAEELTVNGIRTHVDTHSYRAMIDAVEESGRDVENIFTAACSAPQGCTTPEQRRNGVLVIDMGAGTTSWSLSRNDRITAVGHLAVGGDHITNDILCAFHTGTEESATALKHEHGRATLENIDPAVRVDVPVHLGMSRTVNLKALTMVIHARMDETLRIIQADLEARSLLEDLGAGIVLCGGGALLRNLPTLVSSIFGGIPCSLGMLPTLNVPEIDGHPTRIRFAALYGAVLRAGRLENEEADGGSRAFSLSRLFSRSGGRR